METHLQELAQLQRWASGLTLVYAEGAFARASLVVRDAATAELLASLRDVVEALDRRVPHFERAGEAHIVADATRLRAAAVERAVHLLLEGSQPVTR